jgi:hypothetical protein
VEIMKIREIARGITKWTSMTILYHSGGGSGK